MLNHRQRASLIEIARRAMAAAVTGEPCPAERPQDEALCRPAGAFTTLHSAGRLRGCIGLVEPTTPLYQTIQHAAAAAATEDYRFPPVSAAELPELRVEISVLSPLERVADPATIRVGTHGLVVERGAHRGLLLPQVAREWNWDREQFLAHTCEKAGLPPTAWREGAAILSFTALVFGEEAEDVREHYVYLDAAAAMTLLTRHLKTKNLIKHCLATGAVLARLARELAEDEPLWRLTGVLHDVDYDETADQPERHTLLAEEILAAEGIGPEVTNAVKAHNDLAPRDTLLAKALWATDPLTGFLVAAALVTPEKKLAKVDVPFVLNRMKEKSFARAVNREQMADCREIGMDLERFIGLGLEAMQGIAPALGL